MKHDSKMASDTLIGAENRSGRVETVETGLKTGEPSQTAAGAAGGAAGASPEGARAVCAEPLCDTWQQQRKPRRVVVSGRSAGRSPVRVVVWVAGCGRLLGQD